MEDLKQMKKELQKMVKGFREEYGKCSNPKANMNDAQMRKNTATINFEGVAKDFVDYVANSQQMQDFLSKYNATQKFEYIEASKYTKFWQIRINY